MTISIPAATYISQIVNYFDRHHHFDHPMEGVDAIESAEESLKTLRDRITELPSDLRGIIFPNLSMAKWFLATGIARPDEEIKHDLDMRMSIEKSCAIKLRKYKQRTAILGRSNRKQLMGYIFTSVYSAATPERKERILNLMYACTNVADMKRNSYWKIKVQRVTGMIFRNKYFKHLGSLFLAVFVAYHGFFLYWKITSFFLKIISKVISFEIISRFVVKVPFFINTKYNVVSFVRFVFNHQIKLCVFRWALLTVPNNWFSQSNRRLINLIATLLISPTLVSIYLVSFMTIGPAAILYNLSYYTQNRIGDSLQHLSDRSEAERLEIEGMKAYEFWMRLTAEAPQKPAF